jgi:putative spermidine/putrescine transport system substrate-binding protein
MLASVTAAHLRRPLRSEGSAMTRSRLLATAASALVVIGLAACAPPEKKDNGNQTASGVSAKEA